MGLGKTLAIVSILFVVVAVILARRRPPVDPAYTPEKFVTRIAGIDGREYNLVSPHVNLTFARRNLYYNWASYCPHEEVERFDCFWCTYGNNVPLTEVKTFYNETSDVLAYIGIERSEKNIHVIFRATMFTLGSLGKMLDFDQIYPYPDQPNVFVHDGIYHGWKSVESEVREGIETAKRSCPDCSLVITGYSLGGSQAFAAAIDLYRSGVRNMRLIAFGALRFGSKAFSEYLATLDFEKLHFINEHDPATHMGFMRHGWQGAGREIWFDGQVYHECDTTGADESCSIKLSIWQILTHASQHNTYMNDVVYKGVSSGCSVFMKGLKS